MSRRLRICFVAPNGYPVLASDRTVAVVGGAEVQQALLAPEFARRGHDVSMISMDFGQREGDCVKGVRLLKMHAPGAGVRGVRFVHPRFTSLWRALSRADADIYYQRGAGPGAAILACFTRMHGRRMVFASASDENFDLALPALPAVRHRVMYRYGVRNAHHLVVQSERQAQMCRQMFSRSATRINSCYLRGGLTGDPDGPVLWAGTFKALKRPELFLDLAERLPQFRFRMVGGAAAGAAHFEALQQRAAHLDNVEMTGFVPFADVEQQFDKAALLVNTSVVEGFPNTFLQAWSRGIPTVSFFDAGVQFDGADVGVTVPGLEAMVRAVQAMKTDFRLWQQYSVRSRAYFNQNHTIERAVDEYEQVFRELMDDHQGGKK